MSTVVLQKDNVRDWLFVMLRNEILQHCPRILFHFFMEFMWWFSESHECSRNLFNLYPTTLFNWDRPIVLKDILRLSTLWNLINHFFTRERDFKSKKSLFLSTTTKKSITLSQISSNTLSIWSRLFGSFQHKWHSLNVLWKKYLFTDIINVFHIQ